MGIIKTTVANHFIFIEALQQCQHLTLRKYHHYSKNITAISECVQTQSSHFFLSVKKRTFQEYDPQMMTSLEIWQEKLKFNTFLLMERHSNTPLEIWHKNFILIFIDRNSIYRSLYFLKYNSGQYELFFYNTCITYTLCNSTFFTFKLENKSCFFSCVLKSIN